MTMGFDSAKKKCGIMVYDNAAKMYDHWLVDYKRGYWPTYYSYV